MRVLSITTAALAAAALVVTATQEGQAQPRSSRVETEGELLKFDEAASTITVDVKKTGRPPGKFEDAVGRGKEAVFKVNPKGSVLTRSTVKINGKRAELAEIPVGKTVKITWKADKDDPSMPFAWTIDVVFTDEELEQRYNIQDE